MRFEMRHVLFCVQILIIVSWSPAYAQESKSTGLILLDEGQYRSIPLASTPLLGNIPNSVDLSNRFPVPGNQGHQSSCVGWAVAYLKSYQEAVERKWSLLNDEHRFSPSFIYNQIRTTESCEGGSNFIDALNLLRKSGAALWTDFPYDERQCSQRPDASINQRAREFAIADWRRVNVQDETEVKTQLASGFPVLIGMIVDDTFSRLQSNQIYNGPSGQSRGGHAMVVVGYSDQQKAFRVINSWGQTWGDQGFGWIDYAAFRRVVREAYVTQDIVINSPIPPPPVPPTPPAPAEVKVVLDPPVVVHNIMMPTNSGLQSGMQIRIPGRVENAAGRSMQIVVKFNYLNGPALRANPAESVFRDTGGLVATGTQPIPIATNLETTNSVQIAIPYYALNFPATGGKNAWNLSLTVIALVDNQPRGQSAPTSFLFRW